MAARLGNRREGPGPDPEGRDLPREFPDPDFLLFLMISSSVISRAADMFANLALGFGATRNGSGESERGSLRLGFG